MDTSKCSASQPNPLQQQLQVYQALTPKDLNLYAAAIATLLASYHDVLLSDDIRTPCPQTNTCILLENIRSYTPWVWLLVESQQANHPLRVLAIAALDEVHPGQSAQLHGVRLPGSCYTPGVNQIVAHLLETAFGPALNLQTLYAEFEANNNGAKGFCWRYGLRYQKTLPLASRMQGKWQPVHRYELSHKQARRNLASPSVSPD